jgi:hypothetical protein
MTQKEWNVKRYFKLQEKRKQGKLDKEEKKELEEMAMIRLYSMIESDDDVKEVFHKMKARN